MVVSDIVPTTRISGAGQDRTKPAVLRKGWPPFRRAAATEYMVTFRELRDSVWLLDASRIVLNAKRHTMARDDRRFSTRIILLIVVPFLVLLSNTFFKRPTDPCPAFPQSMGEGSP